MKNLVPYVLGEEEYFCSGDAELKKIDQDNINSETWKCKCCNRPVFIDALRSGEETRSYYRLSVKEIEVGNYIYNPSSSDFLSVLAVGKEKNGYFIAIKGYKKLTGIAQDKFYLVLP